MKKFEFLPHTADLRMRVWGSTLEELFQNALAGLAYILGGEAGLPKSSPVKVSADSPTNLLIDFLNEVLYLSNINKAVYDRVEFEKFSERELAGTLRGHGVAGFAEDVKAVTYYGAEINKNSTGEFEVEIVLDI